MFQGIKRSLTDKLFSEIVRRRANWSCEYCLKDFSLRRGILDCSHYITRGNKRTRWDFKNCSSICRGCHDYFGKNPYDHTEFMKKKLGENGLLNLIVRSNRQLNDFKIDEKLIRQGLKIELKRMDAAEKSQILGAH